MTLGNKQSAHIQICINVVARWKFVSWQLSFREKISFEINQVDEFEDLLRLLCSCCLLVFFGRVTTVNQSLVSLGGWPGKAGEVKRKRNDGRQNLTYGSLFIQLFFFLFMAHHRDMARQR